MNRQVPVQKWVIRETCVWPKGPILRIQSFVEEIDLTKTVLEQVMIKVGGGEVLNENVNELKQIIFDYIKLNWENFVYELILSNRINISGGRW